MFLWDCLDDAGVGVVEVHFLQECSEIPDKNPFLKPPNVESPFSCAGLSGDSNTLAEGPVLMGVARRLNLSTSSDMSSSGGTPS